MINHRPFVVKNAYVRHEKTPITHPVKTAFGVMKARHAVFLLVEDEANNRYDRRPLRKKRDLSFVSEGSPSTHSQNFCGAKNFWESFCQLPCQGELGR